MNTSDLLFYNFSYSIIVTVVFLLIIVPVDCGPLSPPLNGQIFIGNTTEGNVATYLCDSGFLLVDGDDSRVCGFDSSWSGDEPTCEGIHDCMLLQINTILSLQN